MTDQIEINYLGIQDDKFRYKVKVNGHWFDYSTGLGWVKITTKKLEKFKIVPDGTYSGKEIPIPENANYFRLDQTGESIIWNSLSRRERNYWHDISKGKIFSQVRIYRQAPTELDILACLYNDKQAGEYNFNDFCDNLGYNNDSIKDFDTYRACMDTAYKLRGYKFPDDIENY